jgi:hypothetical protein
LHGFLSNIFSQAFFNYRVYVLSKKFWLAMPGWILAVIRPAVIITMAVLFGLEGIVVFKERHEWIMYLSFSLTVSVSNLCIHHAG